MKLKPIKRKVEVMTEPTPKPQQTKERTKKPNTLPDDAYHPIYPPVRWLVRIGESHKGDPFKQYMEVAVKRNDADNGLPYLYISMYQESEFYTGYLKGKTNCIPVSEIPTLAGHLKDLYNEAQKDGLVKEFKAEEE